MSTVISQYREAIAALCVEFGVRRLDVFGSAVRPDFDPSRSDIDLTVEFADGLQGNAFDRYFGFKRSLEALLHRPVDLVDLDALRSVRMRKIIERERVPLYGQAA